MLKCQELIGSIGYEDSMTGRIEDIKTIKGKYKPEKDLFGTIKEPDKYDCRIKDKNSMCGKMVLPDTTSIELIKYLQITLERIVKEVEGDSSTAYEGLISKVDKLIYQFEHIAKIYFDTTENWNNKPDLKTEVGDIYIYLDQKDLSEHNVPRLKIGNGGYLIDIGFIDQDYYDHIRNTTVHITQKERENWNDKIKVKISELNREQLVFYK